MYKQEIKRKCPSIGKMRYFKVLIKGLILYEIRVLRNAAQEVFVNFRAKRAKITQQRKPSLINELLILRVTFAVLQEFNTLFLTRFRTCKIARPSQTKT